MENLRVKTVKSFLDIYLAGEEELENVVYLASEICQTPIASITLVDDKMQYPIVGKGDVIETTCDIAFCTHVIKSEHVLEVTDALTDSVFCTNPLVTGNPYIRFYAGAPLTTSTGLTIGTLCVIDHQPKKLSGTQIKSLQILATQVIRRLELRLNMQLLSDRVIKEQHKKELLEQADIMKNVFYDCSSDYFLLLNNNYEIVSFNTASSNFFNRRENGLPLKKGKKLFNYLIPSNVATVYHYLEKAQEGETSTFEILANPGSENAFWNRFTISPAYNSKKELIGIAAIGCNIDKEKRQQEKIEIQLSTLSKIAKMHSHEIRHPLTNILAIIDILKREDFKMTKQYIEFLEISSKELDQVIRKVVFDSYTSA